MGLALLILVLPGRFTLYRQGLPLLCLAALGLSLGYFYYYLGGAPRVIDATAYLLEARNFADGSIGAAIPSPTASFRGRFLIHSAHDSSTLAGIFPPGYPALLSLGVRLGHYQWVGPILAAALVYLTYQLAFTLTSRRRDALVAATLSTLCACLRYHHAETMSHGLSATLTTGALLATLKIYRDSSVLRWHLLLGAALGALIATRQLTGLLVSLSCLLGLICVLRRPRPSQLLTITGTVALGMLPGLALLLYHQYAITGDAFLSPQMRYYSLADGPAHCFGLGLGRGCHYEHADVVLRQGGQGLTLEWALRNTLHRLHFHSLDVANFEPLLLVAFFFAFRARKRRLLWPFFFTLLLLPIGYAFFYFAGNYPGGGARFYASLIPLWQVLIAAGLCSLRAVRIGLFASLLGFSLHASLSHRMLASKHFGPNGSQLSLLPGLLHESRNTLQHSSTDDAPHENQITNWSLPPLVLFSSAHLYNLAWKSSPQFTVARRTHDDREAMLAAQLGNPSVWAWQQTNNGPALQHISFGISSPSSPRLIQLEAEADFPPLALQDLWVHPEYLSSPCVSLGRALALHREGLHPQLTLETGPVPAGHYKVEADFVLARDLCERRLLGTFHLPAPIQLGLSELAGASHIDRIHLIPLSESKE